MCARPLRVGLFMFAGQSPAHRSLPDWSEVADYARHAEAIGVDAIYLGDHLQVSFGPDATFDSWDTPTMLAGIATQTTRVDIGLLMACTAFRNPAVLARIALSLDAMSGGRMRLGLGAGWHDHEFSTFGFPLDHRGGRFAEAIAIISSLLRTGQANISGRWYQCHEAEIGALLSNHRIPIIASGKGERMMRLVAQYADEWNRDFSPEGELDELPTWNQRLDDACRQVGRAPSSLSRSASVRILVPGHSDDLPISTPLTGSVEDIAAGLAAYADNGCTEIDCWVTPGDRSGLDFLGRAIELLDQHGQR